MLETKTLSTQPSFVESIYGHWAEKLAKKKDKPYARFYTKNLDRIDIFIWTDYAEIMALCQL